MSERFLKFIPSDEAMWLLKNKGHAFRLLTIIAESARRYEGAPDGLHICEAFVGGHEKYDMTEQNYRTAKKILVERGHILIVETSRTRRPLTETQRSPNANLTNGVTTEATRVKLLSSSVWDINLEDTNERPNERLTNDQRTTNDKQKKDKNTKKEKEEQHHARSAPLIAEFYTSLSNIIPNLTPEKTTSKQLDAMDWLISTHGEDKVRSVFLFAHRNDFWKAHVHTPFYLKNKFDKLYIMMQGGQNGSSNQKSTNGSHYPNAPRHTTDRSGNPVDISCYQTF